MTAQSQGAGPAVTVVAPTLERAAIEQRRLAGGVVQTTFAVPTDPWNLSDARITCIAAVRDADDAAAALLAALRGCDVVAVVEGSGSWAAGSWAGADDFIEDLRRLGVVRPWTTASSQQPDAGRESDVDSALSADQRQILELLAAGCSLPEVAGQLFLSLRTTERRLSAAKRLLGVRSTAEALATFTGSRT